MDPQALRRPLLDADVIEQHKGCHRHHHNTQRLRHPDSLSEQLPVEEVQAVGPQALDPAAAQAVPQEIEPGVLPVEPTALGHDEQDQQQANQIPEALIEKGRMDLDAGILADPQLHPPGQGSLPAESLPIDEIGPPADDLA